jgi:hypothetical protein
MSDTLLSYCDASADPFGDGGLGAVMPDQWQTISLPATDRITIDIDPALWLTANTPMETIEGFGIALLPRCLTAGWLEGSTQNSAKQSRKLLTERYGNYANLPGVIHPSQMNTKQNVGYPSNLNPHTSKMDVDQESVLVDKFNRVTVNNRSNLNSNLNLNAKLPDDLNTNTDEYKGCGDVDGGTLLVNLVSSTGDFATSYPLNESGLPSHYILDHYVIIIFAIGTINGSVVNFAAFHSQDNTCRFSTIDRKGGTELMGSANAIRFSRFDKYAANVDGGRILGMGLKAWSEAPQITTGGSVYGGWTTHEDLYACFAVNSSTKNLASLQDILQHRQLFDGVDGCTVRYSNGQSPENDEYVIPHVLDYFVQNSNSSSAIGISPTYYNQSYSQHDQVKVGDYIPMIVWKYNSAAAEDLYSIRVEARVHLQGRPLGSSPFSTIETKFDDNLMQVRRLLQDPTVFPIVVAGHSFGSFLKTLGKVASFGWEHHKEIVELVKTAVGIARLASAL